MGDRYAPPWLDQIKYVKTYYVSGCSQSLALYAEYAVPIAKETVIALTTLSITDMVKEFFRPAGLRDSRHGRKGRRTRGPDGGIPDGNELVARKVRSAVAYPGLTYSTPAGIFYVVDDIDDRIANTVFMVELLNDVIYGTLFAVIDVDRTQCPNIRRLKKDGFPHTEGNVGPGWNAVNMGPNAYAIGVFSNNGFTFILPAGTFSCTFGMTITSDGQPNRVALRMRRATGEGIIVAEDGPRDVIPGQTVDLIVSAEIEGPGTYVVEAQDTEWFWFLINSRLVVFEVL